MLQSSSSEKKLVKPLKNCFFGPNLHRKGVIMGYAQDGKKFFLAEITKADHQLSESFYFIKISYVLTELWIFIYLEWCFLSKKCYFQWKQLCWLTDWWIVFLLHLLQFVCPSKYSAKKTAKFLFLNLFLHFLHLFVLKHLRIFVTVVIQSDITTF